MKFLISPNSHKKKKKKKKNVTHCLKLMMGPMCGHKKISREKIKEESQWLAQLHVACRQLFSRVDYCGRFDGLVAPPNYGFISTRHIHFLLLLGCTSCLFLLPYYFYFFLRPSAVVPFSTNASPQMHIWSSEVVFMWQFFFFPFFLFLLGQQSWTRHELSPVSNSGMSR